jgi:nucleoside-diphosphate-sugar epimerase
MGKLTVAVTGSSGFIGSKLAENLGKAGYKVLELDLKKGIDLTNNDSLIKIPPFAVLIHLAAKSFVPDSYEKPFNFYSVNINATLNALELCRKNQATMVFTSSYVYGIPKYLPIDEKHPLQSFNPYADTKIIGEKICQGYHDFFGINTAIVRPFNVYGPNQNKKFLIPTIIIQAKTGRITLQDPKPKRDMIYIDDIIDFYLKLLAYQPSGLEIFNVGCGRSYSVQEIADVIIKKLKSEVKISFLNKQREVEIAETRADISKAKRILSWEPHIDIEDGIARILHGWKTS